MGKKKLIWTGKWNPNIALQSMGSGQQDLGEIPKKQVVREGSTATLEQE